MTMINGQHYNLTVDLEHKIVHALFNLYFAALHDRNNSCCDHDMNSAIYATCRTVFADAGISDQVLDIFEHIFPSMESDQ